MIPQITQDNVRLFIPYKVSKICGYICQREHIPAQQAVSQFYRTRTARLLGALSYLSDNAEILHTQGKNYILGSIEDFLEK